jgi:hypothetical protein
MEMKGDVKMLIYLEKVKAKKPFKKILILLWTCLIFVRKQFFRLNCWRVHFAPYL